MNDPIRYPPAGRDWLPYALLELHAAPAAGDQLESWLKVTLDPLVLPAELTSKVLASVRASAACIPADARKVRLLVYTSATQPAPGQTWGFFRVERNEGKVHAIALYLYLEDSLLSNYPSAGQSITDAS